MAESTSTTNLIQEEFAKDYEPSNTEDITPDILATLNSCKLDLTQDIPDPEVLVSKEGLPVCTRENFSVVVGLAGSRKSFLCTGIAASFMSSKGCIGLDNPSKSGKLLWIDTEQAGGHVARIGRRLHRLIGINTNMNVPEVSVYQFREYQPNERWSLFDAVLALEHPDFVVLDGVSDLITDPNDSAQSSEIINHLLKVTKQYNCHVLTVIHCNTGSEKARGHLGSEALRKCETAILAVANGEITNCKFQKTRDIKPSDFAFTVNDGLPTTTEFVPKQPKQSTATKLSETIEKVMPTLPNTISYTDLCQKIMEERNIQISAARNMISTAKKEGLICQNKNKMYHLPPTQDNTEIEIPF